MMFWRYNFDISCQNKAGYIFFWQFTIFGAIEHNISIFIRWLAYHLWFSYINQSIIFSVLFIYYFQSFFLIRERKTFIPIQTIYTFTIHFKKCAPNSVIFTSDDISNSAFS